MFLGCCFILLLSAAAVASQCASTLLLVAAGLSSPACMLLVVVVCLSEPLMRRCEPELRKVRVTVVFGNSDSAVISGPLL